jgi:hypothetical protein
MTICSFGTCCFPLPVLATSLGPDLNDKGYNDSAVREPAQIDTIMDTNISTCSSLQNMGILFHLDTLPL